MGALHFPWLELSVLITLLGAAWVSLLKDSVLARRISLSICSVTLAFTIGDWIDFSTLKNFEAHDRWDLFEFLFGHAVFVVDELSAPLISLTALIVLITVLATPRTKIPRFSLSHTLISEAILLMTLSCKEPWSVIVLLCLGTIPPLLELINRKRCIRVYAFHMGLFIALLVSGQTLVTFSGENTFPSVTGLFLLTLAILLRCGVVPLHCWMTDLFEKATFGTALLCVTPMIGAYAAMRLVLPFAPDSLLQFAAIASLITAIYAAGMALIQNESRRFFCYLFLSYSSLVLVGFDQMTPVSVTGALCVWLSIGLAMTGFGLTLRAIESRTGRLTLTDYNGLYNHTPTLATFFLITGMTAVGFPFTVGFIGTELLIDGVIEKFPFVGFVVVLTASLNGIAVLQAYFKVFTGTPHTSSVSLCCRKSERSAVFVLTILIIGGGVYPQPGVSSRYHAALEFLHIRQNVASLPLEAQKELNHTEKFDLKKLE